MLCPKARTTSTSVAQSTGQHAHTDACWTHQAFKLLQVISIIFIIHQQAKRCLQGVSCILIKPAVILVCCCCMGTICGR